jgi:hypothetical protein
VHNKGKKNKQEKELPPPKTPDNHGFSMLVPREISFEVNHHDGDTKKQGDHGYEQPFFLSNNNKRTKSEMIKMQKDEDIPTQVAEDMPMQPPEADTQSNDGGDGGRDDDGDDGGVAGGDKNENNGAAGKWKENPRALLEQKVVACTGKVGNNRGNDDVPPPPNSYGDDDSDTIVGLDYCCFCDDEPCVWMQFGADIVEYNRVHHLEVVPAADRPAPNECRRILYRQITSMICGPLGSKIR